MRSIYMLGAALLGTAAIQAAATVEEIAILSREPAALEGIDIGKDGTIFVTNDIDGTIVSVSRDGKIQNRITVAGGHLLSTAADAGRRNVGHLTRQGT